MNILIIDDNDSRIWRAEQYVRKHHPYAEITTVSDADLIVIELNKSWDIICCHINFQLIVELDRLEYTNHYLATNIIVYSMEK